ncbi:hypothetical protein GF376_00690, partial [Candidatus Peregrinibacteria bacterium]|nr:hypothetical protein [Candidatus Peregrinibacteria bacterium]
MPNLNCKLSDHFLIQEGLDDIRNFEELNSAVYETAQTSRDASFLYIEFPNFPKDRIDQILSEAWAAIHASDMFKLKAAACNGLISTLEEAKLKYPKLDEDCIKEAITDGLMRKASLTKESHQGLQRMKYLIDKIVVEENANFVGTRHVDSLSGDNRCDSLITDTRAPKLLAQTEKAEGIYFPVLSNQLILLKKVWGHNTKHDYYIGSYKIATESINTYDNPQFNKRSYAFNEKNY